MIGMSISNRDIMRCFPLLASVLGDKYGVKVQIGGDTAKTDGNTIHIPAMPLNMDGEIMAIARGYLDHEAAHIRHTDFMALAEARMDAATAWIFNAIEDWRVENRLCSIFPGCRANFNALIQRMIVDGEAGDKNPAFSILNYVLLTVRSWDVSGALAQAQRLRNLMANSYPGLADNMDQVLSEVKQNCPDTRAAIDYARRIAAGIRMANPSGSGRQTAAHNAPGQPHGGHEAVAQTKQGETREEGTANIPGKSYEKTCPEISADGNSSADPLEQLNSAIDAAPADLPKNLGELLSSQLETSMAEESDAGIGVAAIASKKTEPLEEEEKDRALMTCNAMRHRLGGLLQTRTMSGRTIGRHGRLHVSSLHRICSGNPKVFVMESPRAGVSTAVHILLDCSSSMDGAAMEVARQSCYAVARALEGIKGVTPAVTLFPASCYSDSVFHLVRHGQKVHDNFRVSAMGDTPLAPALWRLMLEMSGLKEQRKIILVITDGVPNSVKATIHALEQCKLLGLEVYGIGIMLGAIRMLLPDTSETIWKLDELAPAMFGILQNVLLKAGCK